MFIVFGLIPIGDLLVARFVPPARRARVYAVIYVLSFGVGTIAVPVLAWLEATLASRGSTCSWRRWAGSSCWSPSPCRR